MQEKYGIIDIGSNTMRLVIYQYKPIGGYKEVENIKAVARLRNYLDKDQNLNENGVTILLETLKNFEEITNFHGVSVIKVVATATVRKAKNKKEIIDKIQTNTNLTVRVLTEYEEAYYGYLAVVNSTSITEGITIDIGGGSTEVTYFKDRKLMFYHSFPFGVLTLKQHFMKGSVPTEEELGQIVDFLRREISTIDWLKNKQLPIIAIGGSARNVAEIDQRRRLYPIGGLHQYEMSGDHLRLVKKRLMGLSLEQLKKVEGLSEDRADIIFPAIEVFIMFYQITDASAFILSRKGLREGVFYEELLRPLGITMFPNVIEESLFEMGYEYGILSHHVFPVSRLAVDIASKLHQKGLAVIEEKHLSELKQAAFLFQLGRYIDDEASSQHTFYLLANRTIDGLMHRDRLRLAAIASYKSKTMLKQLIEPFEDWFSKEELRELRVMGALLRFAYALHATKRNVVHHVDIRVEQEGLLFSIYCRNSWQAEQLQAIKQKRHLEKVLKRKIILDFQDM